MVCMRIQIQSLASLNGLKIWRYHCCVQVPSLALELMHATGESERKKKKKKIVMGKITTPSEVQIYKPSLERGERIKKIFFT